MALWWDDELHRWHGEAPPRGNRDATIAPVLGAGPVRIEGGGAEIAFCAMSGRVASIDVLDPGATPGPGPRAARRALIGSVAAHGTTPDLDTVGRDTEIAVRPDLSRGPLFLLVQVLPALTARWPDAARPAYPLVALERAAALAALRREHHELVTAQDMAAALDEALPATERLTGAGLCDALRRPRTLPAFIDRFRRTMALLAGTDDNPVTGARHERYKLALLLAEVRRVIDELESQAAAAIPEKQGVAAPTPAAPAAPGADRSSVTNQIGTPVDDGLLHIDELTRRLHGLASTPGRVSPGPVPGWLRVELEIDPAHRPDPPVLRWVLALDRAGTMVGAAPLRPQAGRLLADVATLVPAAQIAITTEPFGRPGSGDLRDVAVATGQAKLAMRARLVDGAGTDTARAAALGAIQTFLDMGLVQRAASLRPLVTPSDLAAAYGSGAADVAATLDAVATAEPVSEWLDPTIIRPLWWWVASDAELAEGRTA